MPTSRTPTPPDGATAVTNRKGRPLSHAEQDLRLFTQIDSRWRRLSGPTAQRWTVERMAEDLGCTLTPKETA